MRTITTIVFLVASGFSCADEWTLIGKSDSSLVFQNPSTITSFDYRDGNYMQGWIREYFKIPEISGSLKYDTTDSLYIIDCNKKEWAIRSGIFRLKNKNIESFNIDISLLKFIPAPPDTTASVITTIFCKNGN